MFSRPIAAFFLCVAAPIGVGRAAPMPAPQAPQTPPNAQTNTTPRAQTATPLAFNEFFEATQSELKPSAKLLSLNGKRVRLVGFMAQMESPPTGAFYLVPHPVVCDEAGGGTADLPPENVLVIVPAMRGKIIGFTPRLLEATGRLEVGNQTDADGRVSAVRLILDSNDDSSANAKHERTKPKNEAPNRATTPPLPLNRQD